MTAFITAHFAVLGRHRRRLLPLLLAGTIVALLSGCGGQGDEVASISSRPEAPVRSTEDVPTSLPLVHVDWQASPSFTFRLDTFAETTEGEMIDGSAIIFEEISDEAESIYVESKLRMLVGGEVFELDPGVSSMGGEFWIPAEDEYIIEEAELWGMILAPIADGGASWPGEITPEDRDGSTVVVLRMDLTERFRDTPVEYWLDSDGLSTRIVLPRADESEREVTITNHGIEAQLPEVSAYRMLQDSTPGRIQTHIFQDFFGADLSPECLEFFDYVTKNNEAPTDIDCEIEP